MAAKIFKVFGAYFTPTSGAEYQIPGVLSMQESPSAQKRTTRADGAIAVTKVYTEGHEMDVSLTMESNDSSVADAGRTAFPSIGVGGSLRVVCKEQATGVGHETAVHTRTYPAASAAALSAAVVTAGPTPSFPIDGNPTSALTFSLSISDGDRTKFVSVAAS